MGVPVGVGGGVPLEVPDSDDVRELEPLVVALAEKEGEIVPVCEPVNERVAVAEDEAVPVCDLVDDLLAVAENDGVPVVLTVELRLAVALEGIVPVCDEEVVALDVALELGVCGGDDVHEAVREAVALRELDTQVNMDHTESPANSVCDGL